MISAYKKFTKVVSGQMLVFWLSSLAVFLAFAIGDDKVVDNPLETSSGVLRSYSFGRGSDFSFMLQLVDNKNLELRFSNFRSRMDGKIEDYVGKDLRVQHYGRLVANCWVGDRQVCFAKCDSDLQCTSSKREIERETYTYFALIDAFSLFCVFFWAVYIRK